MNWQMKAFIPFVLMFVSVARADISTFSVEKVQAKFKIVCQDSQATRTLLRFKAFIASEKEPFSQVDGALRQDDIEIKSDGELIARSGEEVVSIGRLANMPEMDCSQVEGYLKKEFTSEVVLEAPFEAGLDSTQIKSSCRVGGRFEFKGHVRRELYTDLFLIDTRDQSATKLGQMLFVTRDGSCSNFKTIGHGVLSIILSPLLLFLRGC